MKTMIVPLDGSTLAEQALPLATTIARKEDAEIVLTAAIAAGSRWSADEAAREWEAREQAAADFYLLSVAERLQDQGVRARAHSAIGQPQVVISRVADEEGADLILMTTHGRSGLSRWTLGSVADKVLRTTTAPLMLVHPSERVAPTAELKRIVIALDGSRTAEEALPEAERFARAVDASLLLVRAVVPSAAVYGGEALPGALPVLDEMETNAREYLERIAAQVRERGFAVDVATTVGVPAAAIRELCQANGADLIVMTSHGRSGLERWMLGSVTDSVVRHGDIPVLVIRPPIRISEEEPVDVPRVGNAVVPPPVMTETAVGGPSRRPREAPRTHRPERSPGR